MNRLLLSLLTLIVVTTGCAHSTIEKRRKEKQSAYSALPAETRAQVDRGELAVGMPMDAVYISWGKPSQVYSGMSEQGPTTTWVYMGTEWQEHRYFNQRHYGPSFGRHSYHSEPMMGYEYIPRKYPAAEVTFQGNLVKSWRTTVEKPKF